MHLKKSRYYDFISILSTFDVQKRMGHHTDSILINNDKFN